MKKKHRIPNIYAYLAIKVLLAFVAVVVTQITFYVVNRGMHEIGSTGEALKIVWGNVVFGFATVGAALLPYLVLMLIPTEWRWKKWYRVICETLYYVAIVLLVVPAMCDSIYYQHTYRLLSADIFNYLTVGGQMGTLTWMFLADFWPVTLTGVTLLIVLFVVGIKMKLPERDAWRNHKANDWVGFGVGMLLLFVMLRGGFGKHPLSLADAVKYAEPENTVLVSNSLYSVLRTVGIDELPKGEYMTDEEAEKEFSTDFRKNPIDSTFGCRGWRVGAGRYTETVVLGDTVVEERQRMKNVMVIVLESFSQEYMGCYGAEESNTPFLDSLAAHSYVYDGRSNGKKSIEGITAIASSIPTLTYTAYTLSEYYDSTAVALPQILTRHGYHTAFYHGTYNGVMNFDKYCKHAGFEEYLGKNECMDEGYATDKDYDGAWGIFDEPFLQYTCRHQSSIKEPFFSMVFTVTSHHPYPIPKQYKNQFKSAKGENPLLKCIRYTDYSLRRFFETASKEEWYKHTLFIILGDHPGYLLSKPYAKLDGMYRIPFIVYDPSTELSERSERIVQQPDVMPTVLDYLGYGDKCICFGKSLFRTGNEGFQVAYGNGYYILNRTGKEPTVLCGEHERGDEDGQKFLKAYLHQYRKVLRARIDKTEE